MTLIIPDIIKTESNNRFIIHCFFFKKITPNSPLHGTQFVPWSQRFLFASRLARSFVKKIFKKTSGTRVNSLTLHMEIMLCARKPDLLVALISKINRRLLANETDSERNL